jgi:hypothetical protein
MTDIPDWIVATFTGLPVVSGFAVWLTSKFTHARSEALARAREEGRAEQLRVQQAAITQAFHRRFDEIETLVKLVPGHDIQLARLERIVESVRDACIRADLMVPSDTQTGVRNPLLPRPPSRPPPPPPPYQRPK